MVRAGWRAFRRRVGAVLQRPADPFRIDPSPPAISDAARAAAEQLRGANRGPAIVLHGVMPRSGTVYVGELLRLHPDLYSYPNQIWEVPFLARSSDLVRFQERFFDDYDQNRARMGSDDFLTLFGSAFMGYLHSMSPPDRRLLIKEAGVKHIGRFPVAFPHEHLLLLLRDGRDLVHSTLRTWPGTSFSKVCRRWVDSTRAMLEYQRTYGDRDPASCLVRFEDVQRDPETFIREACERFGLDPDRYPFDAIDEVRVIGSSTASAAGRVDWSDHREAPAGFKPTQHWRDWPERRKRRFKALAGDLLIESGYAKDLNW